MIEVTLRFKTDEDKQEFMGQLSDGWGENWVSLDWGHPNVSFEEATVFDVEVHDTFDAYGAHYSEEDEYE
jgi:hypothetical protein